jgi:cytochrome c
MRSVTLTLLTVAATLAGLPAAIAQDARRGQHVFRKCALCHVVDPSAKDLLAPPLHNIIGRRAAVVPGFEYSEIMKTAGQKGLQWSSEALFYFLDRPEDFMPGTYMAFAGLEEQERRDVIAYLEMLTKEFQATRAPKAAAKPSAPPRPPQADPPRRPRQEPSPVKGASPANR